MPDNAMRSGGWQRTDHNASPPALWVITQRYRDPGIVMRHDSVISITAPAHIWHRQLHLAGENQIYLYISIDWELVQWHWRKKIVQVKTEITFNYQYITTHAAAAMKMQKTAVFRASAAPWQGYHTGRTRKKAGVFRLRLCVRICRILCYPPTGVMVIFQDNILYHWLLPGCFG